MHDFRNGQETILSASGNLGELSQTKQNGNYIRLKINALQIKFKLLFFKLNYVVQTLGKQGKQQVK